MIKRIKRLILALSVSAALFVPVAATGVAGAQGIEGNFCRGVNQAATGTESQDCAAEDPEGRLSDIADLIVNTFSWIVGIISVIMIVYGGFKYITSGGDSSKVTSAKNAIIYAIIGLVIVAAAQFIVKFVVTRATTPIAE